MGKIKRSWRLMAASLKLVKKNPSLIVFPLLSCLASLMVLCLLLGVCAVCFGVHLSTSSQVVPEIIRKVGRFLPLLVLSGAMISAFVGIFCHSAVIACMLLQLEGRPHGIRDGARLMWLRRGAIFKWAVFSCVVGFLIHSVGGQMRRVPFLGKAGAIGMNYLAGATWLVLTFLIIPVVLFEEQPSVSANLRRSGELFKRSWGEQVAGRIGALSGLCLVALLVAAPIAATAVIAVTCFHAMASVLTAFVLFFVILLVVFTFVLILLSPLLALVNATYTAVLYSYAVTGMLPQEFSPELLPQPKGV